MILYLNKLFSFFDRSGKIRICGLFVLISIVTLLELCGFGLIYPFLEVMRDPDSIENFPILQQFLSSFIKEGPNQFFWSLGIILALAYIIKNLVLLSLIYLQNRFAKNRIALLSHKMLEGYLALPYIFHLQRNTAHLLRNIENSVLLVFNKGLISLLYIVMESMVTIGLLIIMLFIDPLNTLAVSLVLGAGLIFFYGITKIRVRLWGEKEHDLIAEIYKWVQESIGSIKEIKALKRELFFSDRFAQFVKARAKPQIAYGTMKQSPRVFLESLLVLSMLLVFWITYIQSRSPGSAISVLTMFAVVSFRLLPSINRIGAAIIDLKSSAPALETLHKDYAIVLQNLKLSHKITSPAQDFSFEKKIRFENISFSYPESEKLALKNISFEINKGAVIGIVGQTGAGKTTLIDILLGLLPPSEGRLLVDGHDIYNSPSGWHDKIGYVPQRIYLTDNTLLRNIAFGINDKEVNHDQVMRSIKTAHLEQFISNLPEGLETTVGERGVRLSGGQCQRLGIARALYNDPEILIMDEATSALDNETELEIAKSINQIAQSKTLVIVAHRLSTIRKCDFLIFLKEGTIADRGRFNEIQNRNPDFDRQVQLGTYNGTS